MAFDFTITLGDLGMILSVVIGTLTIYTRLVERLVRIETKVDALWAKYLQRQAE